MKAFDAFFSRIGLIVVLSMASCGGSGSPSQVQDSAGSSGDIQISTVDSPFGFHPAGVFKPGYANNGYGDAQNIGVKWTRQGVYAFWFLVQPDLTKQEYDFSLYDQQWSAIPRGMNILANIAPQGDIDEGYCLPGSYMPVDTDKYIAFVKAVVERYDGDGVNDMPGLTNRLSTGKWGTSRMDSGNPALPSCRRLPTRQSKRRALTVRS
ncbi:MAG: hypothetical protein M1508_11800 [Nitrospirae bacterium]|nr:hypothetical protein [Nitrospirota bacterium]MCL5423305.1 hypothetical protein [Nitrospirota bacterium]